MPNACPSLNDEGSTPDLTGLAIKKTKTDNVMAKVKVGRIVQISITCDDSFLRQQATFLCQALKYTGNLSDRSE